MKRTDNPIVLVVEDDPAVRDVLDEVLQEEGYDVVAVHDGSTALGVLSSLKVDVITLDLELPGLAGSDFLNVLRQHDNDVPPVIIITSHIPVKRSLQNITHAVLPKPFDVDDLLALIAQVLPKERARAVSGDSSEPDTGSTS